MSKSALGILFCLMAFTIWGLAPLFWKHLNHIDVRELLAHRILWCAFFTGIILFIKQKFHEIKKVFNDRKALKMILVCSLLIGSNWGVFVWAIQIGKVLETSLGYFMSPLINVLLGVLFLSEKLNRAQKISVALAAIGVSYLTFNFGQVPWIALYLSSTFGFYGLLKKWVNASALMSLFLETLFLIPFASGYLFFLFFQGKNTYLNQGLGIDLLLIGTGIITALPLTFFAGAVKRLNLSTVGIFQYIAPSLQFALAVFYFQEPFNQSHFIAFCFIWLALIIFSINGYSSRPRKLKVAAPFPTTRKPLATKAP